MKKLFAIIGFILTIIGFILSIISFCDQKYLIQLGAFGNERKIDSHWLKKLQEANIKVKKEPIFSKGLISLILDNPNMSLSEAEEKKKFLENLNREKDLDIRGIFICCDSYAQIDYCCRHRKCTH